MKNDDVELIKRILDGEEIAFTKLVEKYHKPVHALAWRKISDYHIAEEITQDTFLKVYQKLHTLKDISHFSGWLYVITTNLCATWIRKNQKYTERLKKTEITMTQSDTYSQHIRDDRANSVTQTQREIVKKLLAKLKESERTVMTLHYLGEMKIEDISRFLGVSVSTIKTRLMRARQRLRQEETMIRDALEHFKISPNLTDNIMQEISQTRQIAPTTGKPFIPWIVGVTAVTIVLLMLGFSNQFLSRFQKPYSLEAQSEMSVELIDAPIVLNVEMESNVRRELGNTKALGESDNNGQKPDDGLLAAAEPEGETVSVPKQQWYDTGQEETTELSLDIFKPHFIIPKLAVLGNTVYYEKRDGSLVVSFDRGDNWIDLTPGLPFKVKTFKGIVFAGTTVYVATNAGIITSDDGKVWKVVTDSDGANVIMEHLAVDGTTLYGITKKTAVYRLESDSDTWKLLVSKIPAILNFEGGIS
ncbi:sigma-70 family RNA polymerase sigma factor [Candidatus Poribacteria bacterium]|nr:sigma-70 family RNA polymerase sigma factor [Candidatus Poribacteria bacterium]